MNKVFFVLLIVPFVLNAFTVEDSFASWRAQHNKDYATPAEMSYRLSVYKNNLAFIEEHNRKNLGYTVAMNEFGDLTAEEFGSLYLANTFDAPESSNDAYDYDGEELAAAVDWRTKGAVTGVKNQGQCGSCWSFSTTGSTEGQHQIATGKLVSLSEQNLMDCSTSYGNYGCNGGLMDNAFKYIIANKGIDTEASYPYEARDGTCRFKRANVGATITGFKDVKSRSESALQSAVQNVGPISVAIDASHSSFQFYSGGVYFEPACSQTQLDHGVLAVGYGTDAGKNYWIVKNSWGTSWGNQGYIWMSKDKNNNCGIATMASYPTGAH